jgi:signal transduction histidine kinase
MTARKAQVAFVSAILLLLLSGVAALLAFMNLRRGEKLVGHTHAVKDSISEVESLGARLSRSMLAYVLSGDERFLGEYQANLPSLPEALDGLQKKTADNPLQRTNVSRLTEMSGERMELWKSAIELRKSGTPGRAEQEAYASRSLALGTRIAEITRAMKDEEEELLGERRQSADRLFRLTLAIIVGAFGAALVLFFIHYRLLRGELERRQLAEQAARQAEQSTRDGQEALRRLSIRLLQMQDEERRRFSRELHDSLGQYLAGLKMILEQVNPADSRQAALLEDCVRMTDQCIGETRTMSYLLHPPLLDESGVASAAEWYVNGFAQRSGVSVKLDLPKEKLRLPPAVELTLFRILQESLTNIHRHSKSPSADVCLNIESRRAVLSVKDAGSGMPEHFLVRFHRDGTGAGVGLTGISERVRELGGHLEINSSSSGTTVTAVIPLTPEQIEYVDISATAKQHGSAA